MGLENATIKDKEGNLYTYLGSEDNDNGIVDMLLRREDGTNFRFTNCYPVSCETRSPNLKKIDTKSVSITFGAPICRGE